MKIIFAINNCVNGEGKANKIYSISMMLLIAISIMPLFFVVEPQIFVCTDTISVVIFVADYVIRWIMFVVQTDKNKGVALVTYVVTPMAIIDLLSILPAFGFMNSSAKLLRILRLFRLFRVLKFVRHSKELQTIILVIKKQRNALFTTTILALAYVLISALVMLNIEKQFFESFFDAFYWATTALTTVGYGDIYPSSDAGRVISMISSFVGIGIIALPTGIITGGYIEELNNRKKK